MANTDIMRSSGKVGATEVNPLHEQATRGEGALSTSEIAALLQDRARSRATLVTVHDAVGKDGGTPTFSEPWSTHAPFIARYLFLSFGWSPHPASNHASSSRCARLWASAASPVLALAMATPLMANLARPGLAGFSSVSIGFALGSAGLLISATVLTSLTALTPMLKAAYTTTGPAALMTRRSLHRISVSTAVVFCLFLLSAYFSGSTFLVADLAMWRDGGSTDTLLMLNVVRDVTFLIAGPVLSFFIMGNFMAFQVMCTLHSLQLDLLAEFWRRRMLSPFLLVEAPQPLTLTQQCNPRFLPEVRPASFMAEQSAAGDSLASSETMPLSAIVLQYMNVRRSFDYSASAWGFVIFYELYIAWGFFANFAYLCIALGDGQGFPFLLIVVFINTFLLYPLAQMNAKWQLLSTEQLDFSVSRYSLEEQIMLSQLQMKQPLRFTLFSIPITWVTLIVVQHVVLLAIIAAAYRLSTGA